jgi:hypothetical protein
LDENFPKRLEAFEKQLEADKMLLEEQEIALTNSMRKNGASMEEIEKAVTDMKRRYLKQQLINQIKNDLKELEVAAITADQKGEVYKQLHLLRMKLMEAENDLQADLDGAALKTLEEKHEENLRWVDVAAEGFNAVADLSNAFTERRIANIQAEIDANNRLYDGMLDNERLTDEQRTQIEAKRDKENAKLEAKKNKELKKQAKLQKIQAAANVLFSTASAIMTALGAPPYGLGPILGSPFAIAAAGIGAVQLASVMAQPMPQFERGKDPKDRYVGPMIWGEKRQEVKVGEDGRIEYSPNKPSIGMTKKGDTIFPSVPAYQQSISYDDVVKASMLTSIANQHDNLKGYQLENLLDSHLRSARDEMRKGVEDAMRSWKIPTQKQPDLEGVLKRIQKRNV